MKVGDEQHESDNVADYEVPPAEEEGKEEEISQKEAEKEEKEE